MRVAAAPVAVPGPDPGESRAAGGRVLTDRDGTLFAPPSPEA